MKKRLSALLLALLLLLRAVKKDDVMLLPKGDKIYALLHRCRLM